MGEYLGKEDDGVTDRWDWVGPDPEWNAKGFFQDAAFVNFGSAVFGFPPENPRRLTAEERTALSVIITKRASFGVDWGAKEPTLAFYLADFIELCPHPVKLLITSRAASRSIQSWKDRTGDSTPNATAMIGRIAGQVAANAALLPSLTVQFDDLIDNTTATVQAIADFIGKPVTNEALNFPDESLRRY